MKVIPSVNLFDFLSGDLKEFWHFGQYVGDITAGEFLNERLIELGLVKK